VELALGAVDRELVGQGTGLGLPERVLEVDGEGQHRGERVSCGRVGERGRDDLVAGRHRDPHAAHVAGR
jgi:hypothetical protein